MMKNLFEEYAELSELEINEGKRKIIRICNDITPIANRVEFEYEKEFKILGVLIDNRLKKLATNFNKRKKKIRIKIVIWRK